MEIQLKGFNKMNKIFKVSLLSALLVLMSCEIPADLNPDSPDELIKDQIYKIETKIKRMIAVGLKNRRPFLDPLRNPIADFIKKQSGA